MSQEISNLSVTDSTKTTWELLKYDTKYTVKSVGYSLTQPLRWQGDDFTKLGILLAGTATLTFTDNSIRHFAQNNANDFPKVLRDFGWYFGSPQNYFMANAGLYGFGLLTKNENVRRVSILIISSSITTGLLQTFGKNVIGRARPSTNEGHMKFSSLANDPGFRSFPSGHTVLSITMAHSIAKQFKNPWAKIGIYSLGAVPPISRLMDDAHWFTDVAFSAALSIIVVDSVDKYLFKEKAYNQPQNKRQITWNLRFGGNQIGVIGVF